jgi:hypothetical protein
MPRATRSKKLVIAEDDADAAMQIPLPESPASGKTRFVLQEISNNVEHEPEEEVDAITVEDAELAAQLKNLKAAYKTAIGGKKVKKNKGKKKVKEQQIELVVIEDNEPAVVSSAVQEARQILGSDEGKFILLVPAMHGIILTLADEFPTTKKENNAPPSPAVRAAREQLAKAKTGQWDTAVSFPPDYTSFFPREPLRSISVANSPAYEKQSQQENTGRWMQSILSRANILSGVQDSQDGLRTVHRTGGVAQSTSSTKVVITNLEAVEKACEEKDRAMSNTQGEGEDSFVEQIITRSPAKSVSRIEDSVEALDKIEDVIEALEEATTPTLGRSPIRSPTDTMLAIVGENKAAKVVVKPFASMRVKAQDNKRDIKTLAGEEKGQKQVKKVKSSSALGDAVEVSDGKVIATKKLVKRPASLLPPKQPVRAAKPPTQSTFELPGEAVARKLKEQREARQAQRESIAAAPRVAAPKVIKSAKPPTKPTYELPGEALSRRKKEALEARLKAQEEEERKRREFKARPLRKSSVPDVVPRDTAASRARKSQVGMAEIDGVKARPPYGSLGASKRTSIVNLRRTSVMSSHPANTTAHRVPGSVGLNQATHVRRVSKASGPSMSGLSTQRTLSVAEAQQQKQRGKEVYNRGHKSQEEVEKEKREREAAAKKSRLEAAERGRQASREWAERQRAKKASEGVVLAPGFGPGGQIGLK